MADWKTRSLGEVCAIARGGSPRPIQAFLTDADDGINWIKISDATASGKYIYTTAEKIKPAGAARSRVVTDGDFLLSNSMSFGRPYIMRTTGCIHDGWLVLSKYEESFNQDFLYHLLGSPQVFGQFDRLAAGSTVRNLNIDLASRVVVPIPPLPEQRRIVVILDEAFEGIATAKFNAQKNLRNARELLDGLVGEAFSRVSESYGHRRLGDIVDRLTNGFVGPTRDIYVEQGVPYLLARHVRNNQLTFDGRTFVRPEFNEKHKKSKLKRGDVLLVQSGHIGHTAVVGHDHEGHNCHAMIVMTPVDGILVGEFLSYFFNSPEMRRSFESIRSGSTVPHLTCGAVKELGIPLPPISDQQRLIRQIDELESEASRLCNLSTSKIAALDELKKSLLHQAFSGAL